MACECVEAFQDSCMARLHRPPTSALAGDSKPPVLPRASGTASVIAKMAGKSMTHLPAGLGAAEAFDSSERMAIQSPAIVTTIVSSDSASPTRRESRSCKAFSPARRVSAATARPSCTGLATAATWNACRATSAFTSASRPSIWRRIGSETSMPESRARLSTASDCVRAVSSLVSRPAIWAAAAPPAEAASWHCAHTEPAPASISIPGYPMGVSVTHGGAKELVQAGNVVSVFQVMSNELSTPKVVVCPNDANAFYATNFGGLANSNISYFASVDVTNELNPKMLVSGDCNFEIGRKPIRSGLVLVSAKDSVGWSATRHEYGGNLLPRREPNQTLSA